MLEALTGVIIHLIQSLGYFGIFFLMVLNSLGIPIPSEVTLPFAGFLASNGSLSLVFVIITAVVGDLVGGLVGYSIGYFLEENLLISFIDKYGKFILITTHDYHLATNWLKKYGAPVVFIGKMIPGIKSFVAIAAGVSEIKFPKFILSNVFGGVIYCSGVTYLGFYLGSKWDSIGGYFRKFELVIAVLLILGVIWYVNHKLKIIKLKK